MKNEAGVSASSSPIEVKDASLSIAVSGLVDELPVAVSGEETLFEFSFVLSGDGVLVELFSLETTLFEVSVVNTCASSDVPITLDCSSTPVDVAVVSSGVDAV